jgi:hypothetical protein
VPIAYVPDMDTAPYRPGGFPLYWMDEQSGALARAVRAWLSYRCNERTAPDAEQIKLLVEYCAHWVKAPCWERATDDLEYVAQLESLRLRAALEIKSADDLAKWLHDCLEFGLDPF